MIVDATAPVGAAGVCLSEDDYLSSFEGEIRRQDCFNFHGIAPSGLLLLEQGQFVMLQRLGDLRWKICNYGYDFFKSISSSFHDFGSHQFIKDSALLLLNPLKHLPLYLFSFSESDFNPAHYISVLPNNPKENVILTYWRENQHTIDSQSVIQVRG